VVASYDQTQMSPDPVIILYTLPLISIDLYFLCKLLDNVIDEILNDEDVQIPSLVSSI